ncbi:MAG: CoA ester lyase [Thiogranum sp.]|nr:CoA ester lyase [Thiogranum sp.]
MRSLLFVPGNMPAMLDKALGFSPDAFVPDLEDSVPDAEKENARRITAAHLSKLGAGGIPVIPRVNAHNSGWLEEDLAAVVGSSIYAISVGKIQSADDIAAISETLSGLESEAELEVGKIRLIPWIETARAVVHCFQICTASPRIVAVAFGAEDFTDDMGIERSEDESELAYARSVVCTAARAAGIDALDTPFFGFKDPDGLRENVRAAKRLGFKGKFAIHPAQVDPINTLFSPSEAEIAYARRVVSAFEEAERTRRGSTSLDGKVIDVPVVKRARSILALADARFRTS